MGNSTIDTFLTSSADVTAGDDVTSGGEVPGSGAEEYPNYFLLHPELTFIYLTFLTSFMTIGNIGNVLVIGAVISDKRLLVQGNVFILNLAIADLCVTSFVDPMSIAGVVLGPKYFNDRPELCKAIGSICLASCVCSLYNIAAISLNRYILICKNEHYMRIFTWKRTVLYALGLWGCAWLLDIPNYTYWGGHGYDLKTMACSYDRTASYSYTAFFISMFVTVPLLTVLACNVSIYTFVLRSKRRVGGYDSSKQSTVTKPQIAVISSANTSGTTRPPVDIDDDETSYISIYKDDPDMEGSPGSRTRTVRSRVRGSDIRLAKTLFIVFVVFLVCWTPYALICLIDIHDEWSKTAYVIAIKLAHTNSSLNSVLYAALNKNFRSGYKLFLGKIFCQFRKR